MRRTINMIEVKARILQRAVFITGECLHCEVIIINHGRKRDQRDTNLSSDNPLIQIHKPDIYSRTLSSDCDRKDDHDETVTLAWASAQVYCHCNINERLMKLPSDILYNSRQAHGSQFTSFSPVMGEKGHCLCSTTASVLFCDLSLKKGERRKFIYVQLLQNDLPPSYKGQNIKLSYKVCIGIGRIGKPLSMIRLPFRLYEIKGLYKPLKDKTIVAELVEEDKSQLGNLEHTKQRNPFLKEDLVEKCSILDTAMETLTALSVKRNMNTYNIQSVNGTVGKFCLSKYYYRLGEDVLGTFDFSEGPISCIKYMVSLQVEETISKNCLLRPTASNLVQYVTMSYYEECCCLATKTHFLLPIPVTATSDFNHKIVSVRWRLHFEFIIDSTNKDLENSEQEEDLEGIVPKKFKTESMLWDLPVHVLATNPIQASLMMQAESTETIRLRNS